MNDSHHITIEYAVSPESIVAVHLKLFINDRSICCNQSKFNLYFFLNDVLLSTCSVYKTLFM